MCEMKGLISGSIHYDNVALCVVGGMQLTIQKQNVILRYLTIDFKL
ncbi:hypothetical protein [Pantoea sp. Mhis]|nr:hypothetical protein [Pantoea sp. Mhis]